MQKLYPWHLMTTFSMYFVDAVGGGGGGGWMYLFYTGRKRITCSIPVTFRFAFKICLL